MNRYEKGKIYRIIAPDGAVYIGSTITTLACRFGCHRTAYRSWKKGKGRLTTVYNMFDKHGIENCKIELIEDFPCLSKKELDRREGEIIKSTECINQIIPGRNGIEYRVDNKDILSEKFKKFYNENKEQEKERVKRYADENKEKIKERQQVYAQKNQDKIRERKRKYCQKNIEKIREQKRKWNELNRDKINARKRELRSMKNQQD